MQALAQTETHADAWDSNKANYTGRDIEFRDKLRPFPNENAEFQHAEENSTADYIKWWNSASTNMETPRKEAIAPNLQSTLDSQFNERREAQINANRRIQLLARKYVDGQAQKELNKETTARIQILEARLEKLAPSYTQQDWDNLDSFVSSIEELKDAIQESK